MTDRADRSFALLGASGLVGGHLLDLLATDTRYARGTLLGRRPFAAPAGKTLGTNVTDVVVDFDRPEGLRGHLAVDDVFCCLGTTIKKAGSQAAFHKGRLRHSRGGRPRGARGRRRAVSHRHGCRGRRRRAASSTTG